MAETQRKKRILIVNESQSSLTTGYANLGKELYLQFAASNKYELAELACYLGPDQPHPPVPWKVYPNEPSANSPQNVLQEYQADPTKQFGLQNFHNVVLDFKPDVVMAFRDPWMDEHIVNSPLRNYYQFAWMPTVDSAPCDEGWIYNFSRADAVFTYTDWSKEVLKEEGGDQIHVLGTASPGVDSETFKPVQFKSAHKEQFGLKDDITIVGFVGRNQRRKLLPDLYEGFRKILDKLPKEQAEKTFLLNYCSFPDVGFDLPRLLKLYGLSHKVLFVYICSNCGTFRPQFYSDVRCVCPKCKQLSFQTPTTKNGLSREALAAIYNLFDLYIQVAICGGFEIPIIEAASSGVPVFVSDYSALSDVVRKVGGTPIKISRLFCEAETGCYRSYFDINDMVDKVVQFLQLPKAMRDKKGRDTRKRIEQGIYAWGKSARAWMDYFDGAQFMEKWGEPPKIHQPQPIPAEHTNWTNSQFVDWAIQAVLGRPDLLNSYQSAKWKKYLNWSMLPGMYGGADAMSNEASLIGMKPSWQSFTRETLVQQMVAMRNEINHWETLRVRSL
jgi:glycosyltransferase involved in cell wall biosynthesis